MTNIVKHSVAEAYGRALFDLCLESVCDDIAEVSSVFESQNEFKAFMENPGISIAKRKEVFENVFGTKISELANNFFGVLIGNGKIDCLSDILKKFEKFVEEKNGIVEITVTVSNEMDENSIDELKVKLAEACDQEVKMNLIVDPRILGGIIINYGDSVIDNSVSKAVERALQ